MKPESLLGLLVTFRKTSYALRSKRRQSFWGSALFSTGESSVDSNKRRTADRLLHGPVPQNGVIVDPVVGVVQRSILAGQDRKSDSVTACPAVVRIHSERSAAVDRSGPA